MPDLLTTPLLPRGSRGQDVIHLQSALATVGLLRGDIDGCFGPVTVTALRAFQNASRLPVTGDLTPETAAALGWKPWRPSLPQATPVPIDIAATLFPQAPRANLEANFPPVIDALTDFGLATVDMTLMALATIRVETCTFLPISEQQSPFNTSPGGTPFDLYDKRPGLGNEGAPDGSLYRGRGFVQLTGRANYAKFGTQIGVTLIENPFLAHRSDIAARLLAAFLKNRAPRITSALADERLGDARKLVNGGSNGLAEFRTAFLRGKQLLAA